MNCRAEIIVNIERALWVLKAAILLLSGLACQQVATYKEKIRLQIVKNSIETEAAGTVATWVLLDDGMPLTKESS